MRIHPDIEVEHHEDDGLQPLGEIKARQRVAERFVRAVGNEQDVLGVPMRGEGAEEQVGLLGAGRTFRRRAAALHVEHHDWNCEEARPKNSCISEMPGPEVAVKVEPFEPATAIPIAAISSSAWTMA